MINKKLALLTILSIAVIGIVAGTGINANDCINNNNTQSNVPIHYVEEGNASDIQAKIDSLPRTGGVVFLPAGVYNTTAIGAISITKSNVTLCGAGESTVITTAGSNYLLTVTNAEYISIRGIRFTDKIKAMNMNWSDITNSKLSLLYLSSSSNNSIANNNIDCISLNSNSKHNKIINNRYYSDALSIYIENSDFNIIENNTMVRSANYVIEIDDGSYNKLIANTLIVTGSSGYIIYLKDSSSYNLIYGNYIDSTSGTGACYAVGSDSSEKRNNQISANIILKASLYIEDNEVSQLGCKHTIITNNLIDGMSAVQYGIHVDEAAAVSGYDDEAYNLISGNKIYNCTSRSIFVEHSCHNIITDNECYGNGKDGIILYNGANYNTVSNNNCYNNTDCGIMLEDSNHCNLVTNNYCHENEKDGIMLFKSDNNIVSGNDLYHNGYCGIWIRDESDNNTITGNRAVSNGWNCGGVGAADAPWSGIRVGTNCDNNLIKSNRCFDNQSIKTQGWGISITDLPSENNRVHDNYVGGNRIGGITDSGTGSDIKDNEGYNPGGIRTRSPVPLYPVPKLLTIILTSAGLVALVGYVVYSKRKNNKSQ